MANRSLSIVLLGSLLLTCACASSASDEDSNVVATDSGCINPVSGPTCRIPVDDGSFVRWVGPVTDGIDDGISTAIVEHTPRRVCMSGTVDSGPTDQGWGALLMVGLSAVDDATHMLVAPLNASALGVTQVRFTLENPPLVGLVAGLSQLETAECTEVPACSRRSFRNSPILVSGQVTIPFSDFTRVESAEASTPVNLRLITNLEFDVRTLSGMPFAYDFCLRDIALLDALGREITPVRE